MNIDQEFMAESTEICNVSVRAGEVRHVKTRGLVK